MLDIGYWLTSKQRGVQSLTRTGDDPSGMIRSQSSANHVRIPALVLIAGVGGVDEAKVGYQDSLGFAGHDAQKQRGLQHRSHGDSSAPLDGER